MVTYSDMDSLCEVSCRAHSRASAADPRTRGFLSLTVSQMELKSTLRLANINAGVF